MPHSLPPTPQLILSGKPPFILFREMEAKGQKLQLLPTMSANLPACLSMSSFLGRDAFPPTKPNPPLVLRAPFLSRDITLLAISALLFLSQVLLLYWVFSISSQTCSTPIVLRPLNLKVKKIFLTVGRRLPIWAADFLFSEHIQ